MSETETPGDLLMAETIKELAEDVTYWRDRALRAESLVSSLKAMCYDVMRPIVAWESEPRTMREVRAAPLNQPGPAEPDTRKEPS